MVFYLSIVATYAFIAHAVAPSHGELGLWPVDYRRGRFFLNWSNGVIIVSMNNRSRVPISGSTRSFLSIESQVRFEEITLKYVCFSAFYPSFNLWFTSGNRTAVQNYHAARRQRESTICTSFVYGYNSIRNSSLGSSCFNFFLLTLFFFRFVLHTTFAHELRIDVLLRFFFLNFLSSAPLLILF
jgi:hypothetical protein